MTKSATPYTDAAEQYARDVIDGKVIACKWIRLLAEKHFRDKELKDSPRTIETIDDKDIKKKRHIQGKSDFDLYAFVCKK